MKGSIGVAWLVVGLGCGSQALPAAAPAATLGVAHSALALRLERRVEQDIVLADPPADENAHVTLAERMATHRVPGVSVAVFDHYALIWAKGYGLADVETEMPVGLDTLFQAGSISKSVNALAVLQAASQGRFSLDAPINGLLRSWQLPDNDFTRAVPVTLRRLLSHTAGTNVHGFPGYATGAPVPTLLQVLGGTPPANTPAIRVELLPGSRFRYSGGGISITQLVLVDTFGQPYPTLLDEHVLVPLGMTNSTYQQPLPPERLTHAAAGYDSAGTEIPSKRHVYPEMAAAGLWTTPGDLATFFLELARARANRSTHVSQAIATSMTTEVDRESHAALGVFVFNRNGDTLFGHQGADAGFQADACASLDGGYGMVVMANSDQGSRLFPEIERTVFTAMGWGEGEPAQSRR